jgi:gas vesicle protein
MENAIRTNGTALHDSVGLLTGLLIGGLAGFGTMMLLAPHSGKNIRAQIKQKSAGFQGRVTDIFDDLVTLSHYDNRIILVGIREKADDR